MIDAIGEHHFVVTDEAIAHLDVMRKWTMFLAILGFIGSGLLILFGLVFAVVMRAFGQSQEFSPFISILLGAVYTALGVAYCFPAYFLFRFSTNVKSALASQSNELFTTALKNLRTFFVFIGGAVIAMIVLYILIVIAAVLIGVLGAFHAGLRT